MTIKSEQEMLNEVKNEAQEEGSEVVIERVGSQPSRGEEGIRRLRQAQRGTGLSTADLLARTRGEAPPAQS